MMAIIVWYALTAGGPAMCTAPMPIRQASWQVREVNGYYYAGYKVARVVADTDPEYSEVRANCKIAVGWQ